MKKINAAIPAIIIATALGASSGLYIKSLPFSSLAFTGFRMGVPFLFFLPMIAKRNLLLGPVQNRKKIWTGSVLNALRMFLYILAYKMTTITNAVVLLYLWPIFALAMESLIKRESIQRKKIILLLISLSGVVLLNIQNGAAFSRKDLTGSIMMIFAAFFLAVTTIIFKDSLKQNSEGEVLYFQNVTGALIFIPILLLEVSKVSLMDNFLGLVYGLSVGVMGFGLLFFSLKRLSLFQYGALSYIEVFFGVSYGILLLGEEVSWSIVIGALLILVSSFLARQTG